MKRPSAPTAAQTRSDRQEGVAPVRLSILEGVDLPLVEKLVRAYYAEDGHTFQDDRQPAALAALAAGDPFGRA